MRQTIAQKVFSRKAGRAVRAGEFATVPVDCAVVHNEAFALAWRELNAMGLGEVWDPRKVVVVMDHQIPANSEHAVGLQSMVRKVVETLGIDYYYGEREGISHQVVMENGHVQPSSLIVGADSHACTYGALGAAGTGIGAAEVGYLLARGELWFQVPESIRITLTGQLPDLVTSKDIILSVTGKLGTEVAQYKSVEFTGETSEELSVESRMTISSMVAEIGAKFGFFDVDQKVLDYLGQRATGPFAGVSADPDASYVATYEFDVTELEPQIACPHSVGNVKPVGEVQGVPVNQAILGSCTNGRYEDLTLAAEILKGRKVARFTRLYVYPASREVYLKAIDDGLLRTFSEAGAVVCNPGWGPRSGEHAGLLGPGETCISSTSRNSKGAMGSAEAEVYLASPATVAASAIRGVITDPREL